jgi:tetrapyrrole methylase family protein/MazG family protein/ATP diphosphatase
MTKEKRHSDQKVEKAFSELRSIASRLRAPDGCPWDRKQTPSSIKKYILEEAYELSEAIDKKEHKLIAEELGDLFFLLLLLANIYEDSDSLFLEQVFAGIAQKMIRRHPHIFGNVKVNSIEEVAANWQAIKAKESEEKGENYSILGHLPQSLPALQRAFRVGERASRVNFDWIKAEDVWTKIAEEEQELKEAVKHDSAKDIEHEIGDLLFTVANMSRKLKINPEEALQKTIDRFVKRFNAMEEIIKSKGNELTQCTIEEINSNWAEAKKIT